MKWKLINSMKQALYALQLRPDDTALTLEEAMLVQQVNMSSGALLPDPGYVSAMDLNEDR